MITGQFSKLLDIRLQDRAVIACPTISDLQFLKTQSACVGDHCL